MGLLSGSGLGTPLSVMCRKEELRLKSEYWVGVKSLFQGGLSTPDTIMEKLLLA